MAYSCQQCNFEKGLFSQLVAEESSRVLVCPLNRQHRYEVDSKGYIHPARN